jgi:hypothetical protein
MSKGDRRQIPLAHVTIVMPRWLHATLMDAARERGQTCSTLARTALESHLMETVNEQSQT